MDAFEYVMVLVSIIIGLALTHILTALGSAVHRLRGHGPPIRLEATYLLWVGFVLIWLVSFWWWEFRFQELQIEWTFGLYLFIILYAVWLFLLSVVLVPGGMEGLDESYGYLMSVRRWFFGALFGALVLDTVDTFVKGVDWGVRPIFIVQTAVFLGACVIGVATDNRRIQLGAVIAAFTMQVVYMFLELDILSV